MVDFQSRDTRRTFGGDEEDDGENDEPDGEDRGGDGAEQEAHPPEDERGTDSGRESSVDTAPGPGGVSYAVVTVGADGTLDDDPAGDGVVEAVEAAGGAVATRELLAPSYDGIQAAVNALVDRGDVEAIVTVGGTGVEPSDVTVGAAKDTFDKHLPGFGELFRALAYDRDGTAAVRTRTTGGVIDGVPVFCLPGDPAAARLGVEEIVLAEAGELAAQARDGTADG